MCCSFAGHIQHVLWGMHSPGKMMNCRGQTEKSRKSYACPIFSIAISILTALGLRPGICNENTACAFRALSVPRTSLILLTVCIEERRMCVIKFISPVASKALRQTELAKKHIRTPPLSVCRIVAGEIETPSAHLILPYFMLPEIFVVSTRAAGARLGTRRERENSEEKRKDCCCFGWRTKFTRSCITGRMLNFLRGKTTRSKERAE